MPQTDKKKPAFSQNLFWEYDVDNIDVDRYAHMVIVRVLERGSLEDWHKIKAYYPINVIKEAAMTVRSLEPTAMSFIAAITHTPIEEFRCYKLLQSNPELCFY